MSNTWEATMVKKVLKCKEESAKEIANEVYNYYLPDWSAMDNSDLKEIFLDTAELAGIKIKYMGF